MLRSLRDGAKSGFLKFILLGFMALAVGGLVLTDVGGFFRGGISSNLVAKGKGIEISAAQFDQTVRRVLSRQNISTEVAYNARLIHQILQSEIQSQIISEEVKKNNILINDDLIAEKISEITPPTANGSISKSDAIRQTLRAQGISEQQFIQAIRQEMAHNLYTQAAFTSSQVVSESATIDIERYNQEVRNVNGYIFSPQSIKNISAPNTDQLNTYYDANKASFLVAETRNFTIATLKKEMLKGSITISDDVIREAYADSIDQFQKPELRTLEQTVLPNEALAQKVLSSYKETKSLKKSTINITGKQSNYLGSNDFIKQGLPKEIAEPSFSAKKGDIIGPIQSPLGWHLLKLQSITPAHTRSFNSVKNILRDDLLTEQLAEELENAANTIDDRLASEEPLDNIVAEMGLTTETFTNVKLSGLNQKNKDVLSAYQNDKAQIIQTAFDYNVGQSSAVIQLDDGRYITIRVDAISPKTYIPLEQVRSELNKKWISEQKAIQVRENASTYLGELQKNATPETPNQSKKVTYKDLKRNEKSNKNLSQQFLDIIFNAQKSEPFTAPLEGRKVFVGRVTSINLPEKAKQNSNTKANDNSILQQEAFTLYLNTLAQRYKVKINEKTLKKIYGTPLEDQR